MNCWETYTLRISNNKTILSEGTYLSTDRIQFNSIYDTCSEHSIFVSKHPQKIVIGKHKKYALLSINRRCRPFRRCEHFVFGAIDTSTSTQVPPKYAINTELDIPPAAPHPPFPFQPFERYTCDELLAYLHTTHSPPTRCYANEDK